MILGRSGTQYVVMVGTFLIIIFVHLANLHMKMRYLKEVNGTFLLIQTTCLCFKMA